MIINISNSMHSLRILLQQVKDPCIGTISPESKLDSDLRVLSRVNSIGQFYKERQLYAFPTNFYNQNDKR